MPAPSVPGTAAGATDVDGPLAWRECGRGDPVVFLHGLGGSRTSWEPQLSGLSGEFRCIAWDMPGYGASDPVAPLTFTAIADAVVRLLDDAGVDRAHLVGESFGGMHALHTALRRPERVARLVLANTSPAFGLDGTDPVAWRAGRLAPLDAGLAPADIAEDVLTSIAGPTLGDDALTMRVAGFARIQAAGLRAAVECLPAHDVRDRLGAIASPALVVAGGLDAETPVAYSRILTDGLANAELIVLDGVGHLAASEVPQTFNRLVRDFLNRGRGLGPSGPRWAI
ncbi:MAG: alpha/beta hydrolase [Acidimicrobiaceae bacterium]|nr:alpha/beta hydrolase [Acidimicrobiaceae bacterium]